ncbi:hypothetical protein, partial [Rhizobium sp. YK2]|uniref:hypothetical protein n=1 Tax=Rhizobium sp. YK2 TaxID=1860096 RepID=UPI001AEC7430
FKESCSRRLHGRGKAALMRGRAKSADPWRIWEHVEFGRQTICFAGFQAISCLAVSKTATYIRGITAVMAAQSSRPSRKGLSMECLTGVPIACFKERMTWQK